MELIQAHVNEQLNQALLERHLFNFWPVNQGFTLDSRRSGADTRVFNLDPVI